MEIVGLAVYGWVSRIDVDLVLAMHAAAQYQ
jgi:hypothetical protein